MLCGLPPTAIVSGLLPPCGSMRVTVPSPLFATQTEPGADGDSDGIPPDRDRRRHRPACSGRCGRRASSSESATQTPPAPSAIAAGPWPTGIVVSSPVGSTRVTVFASPSVNQTASAPTATAVGPAFGSIVLTTTARARVKSRQEAPGRGHPDGLPDRRHRTRPTRRDVADLDPLPNRYRTADRYAGRSPTDRSGSSSTTQVAPGEAASPVGVSRTGNVRMTLRVAGSINSPAGRR